MPKAAGRDDRRGARRRVLEPDEILSPELLEELRVRKEKPWYKSMERKEFVQGLLGELNINLHRYMELVAQSANLQARLEIAERNVVLTRDHLSAVLEDTVDEVPPDWKDMMQAIRFVGARLGDACFVILKERGKATTEEMLAHLNSGQFRFRTGSPLREIHAALLRHPRVERIDDEWVYKRRRATTAKKKQ